MASNQPARPRSEPIGQVNRPGAPTPIPVSEDIDTILGGEPAIVYRPVEFQTAQTYFDEQEQRRTIHISPNTQVSYVVHIYPDQIYINTEKVTRDNPGGHHWRTDFVRVAGNQQIDCPKGILQQQLFQTVDPLTGRRVGETAAVLVKRGSNEVISDRPIC